MQRCFFVIVLICRCLMVLMHPVGFTGDMAFGEYRFS